jgi:glycosyltransferase involved in cell wall biosynthesis
MADSLAILILTGNEERNIERCLRSLRALDATVHIVDSESTDRTVELATAMGAQVVVRRWTTYADQFNWGLEHCGISARWVMRLDADEEVTPELAAAIRDFLAAPPEAVSGMWVRRRVYFMGRWIRHGGYYPTWLLRVFRHGVGRCEHLNMDEHIVLDHGTTVRVKADVIDRNDKDLTVWVNKHNGYATREMRDVLETHAPAGDAGAASGARPAPGGQASSKRWLKTNVYLRLPLFVRPTLYFLYRYFLLLGFLDGREGLVFHVLQGFWYRFLVDAKLLEHEKHVREGRVG